jgi:hypothetical protein
MPKSVLKSGLIALFLVTAGGTPVALAHPDHQHQAPRPEIDEAAAKTRAQAELERLMSKKKIDPSWKDAAINAVEKKQLKKRWEWLVTFNNPTADAKKQTLYVFLKPSGDFVAANFTGK